MASTNRAWFAMVVLAAIGVAGCSGTDNSSEPALDVGTDVMLDASGGSIADAAIDADTANGETATVDTALDDAGAVDSGAIDAGAGDSGALDSGAIDSAADVGCMPGSTRSCYSGGSTDVFGGTSACKRGLEECIAGSFGPCVGEVLPSTESCGTTIDDNCDGVVNEGCVCTPFATRSCYSGPAGTQGVGICKAGTETCNAAGTAWGPCLGEVKPNLESCKNSLDDDCNGVANNGCAGLTCPSFYTESFDDGAASPLTSGVYKVDWCDSYIPLATNTPLCMTGRTMRTNATSGTPYGGLWVSKATASCSAVRLGYDWYQFANAAAVVEYKQTSDASALSASCNVTSGWTTAVPSSSMATLQVCSTMSVDIPFGSSPAVYIKFKSTGGANAMWWDNIRLTLIGCDC